MVASKASVGERSCADKAQRHYHAYIREGAAIPEGGFADFKF